MVLKEETIEALALRYIKPGMILSFGASQESEVFLKKIAFMMEEKKIKLSVVPTSHAIAIDLAFEFASQIDFDFNYIKTDSLSFIRDKMIAQSAEELIVIADKKNFVQRLHGIVPCEIVHFGCQRTIVQLEKLGRVKLRKINEKEVRTETNHLIADVLVDEVYDLDEIEFQAKEVPGVIETGLFIGYADRIILHNHSLEVKSRLDFDKQ